MRIRFLALLLVLLTFASYASSFSNQFVWDDEQFLYKNVYVRDFAVSQIFTTSTTAGANTNSDYYRPFTTLSLSLDYQFWGLNPVGFHLTNTTLHALAGVLLFLLLLRLGMQKFGAFAVSSIFLLHPIQTEAVVYVNSRGDSLSALYGLLTCHVYMSYIRKRQYRISVYNRTVKINATQLLIFTPLLYISSFLSKEIGLAWGGILFLLTLYEYTPSTFLSDAKNHFKHFLQKVTALLFSAAAAVLYLTLRATVLNFENTFATAGDGSVYYTNMFVRLLSFSKIVFIYCKLLLIPYPLHMERSSEVITTLASPWPWLFVGLLILLILAARYEYIKKRTWWIAFGSFWFFALLVPTSGIIAINGMLYEHWLYVPQVGFWIVLGRMLTLIPKSTYILNATKLLFLCVVLCSYSVLTMRQNYYWSTPIRFYEYLLQYTDSARIHNNLGMAYADAGRPRDAVVAYTTALEYGTPYPQIYHNLGNTLKELDDPEKAEEAFTTAIELDSDFINPYLGLLSLYQETEQTEKALSTVLQAQQQFPKLFQFYVLEAELHDSLSSTEKQALRKKVQTAFPGQPQYIVELERVLSTR